MKKFSKRLYLLSLLISFCLTPPIMGITLVDTGTNKEFSNKQESSIGNFIKDLSQNGKYLIQQANDFSEVHFFNEDGSYSKSYIFDNKTISSASFNSFSNEPILYNNAGFLNMPNKHISNIRNYDWYVDQGSTGVYSSVNCGPSSVEMAFNWLDQENTLKASFFRSITVPAGGWIYTSDIEDVFDEYGILYDTIFVKGEETLKKIIDSGEISILCLDTSYLSSGSYNSRIGRFYDFSGGHFVVLTGYLELENETYFEIYDPNSFGEINPSSKKPLGQGRFIKSKDLTTSIDNWWRYTINIKKTTQIPQI